MKKSAVKRKFKVAPQDGLGVRLEGNTIAFIFEVTDKSWGVDKQGEPVPCGVLIKLKLKAGIPFKPVEKYVADARDMSTAGIPQLNFAPHVLKPITWADFVARGYTNPADVTSSVTVAVDAGVS
jgi:hypothetical protein